MSFLQFISPQKTCSAWTPSTGLVTWVVFFSFFFPGIVSYQLWPNLIFTFQSSIINVDFAVCVQNSFSKNMLQARPSSAPVQRCLFQCNAVAVADLFDQAACRYRIDANSQSELLFQINTEIGFLRLTRLQIVFENGIISHCLGGFHKRQCSPSGLRSGSQRTLNV